MTYRRLIDINCDMGEAFGPWRLGGVDDADLFPLITSANVAAGFHAGDPNHIDRSVQLARQHGVGLGSHPGYGDLQGFGRRTIKAPPAELMNDVVYQMGAVREFGRRYGVPVRHVKLHGALAVDAAVDEALSEAFIELLRTYEPDLPALGMHAAVTCRIANEKGQPYVREFYADRGYDKSGRIVFARQVTRPDPEALAARVVKACQEGTVETVDGETIEIPFESICFHSDTPGSLDIIKAIRAGLEQVGIKVVPFSEVMASV
ncbi:MAG TPA: 5-oxoprolinase subunit PxpA [Geminicoccus sp.]|uniref:5-oxoprolinase subunit PxpA n=1 Tax=Geminicoccus sp. TaxID=2024832 RepID=UPI002E31B8EC|nr:5-oxoprolinase subunit PxpA [Geminicoccus sp.]HEX2528215.1 5-oxoprolinase subunit PxpA [Geminicoccus sp.]